MSKTALNCLQKAPDLVVASWDLDADELVVLLNGAVRLAVGTVVDEAGYLLGKTVANVTELIVGTVDFVRVVAVGTLAGVHFEVVGSPALGSVNWTRNFANWILEEANHSLLFGGGRGLGRRGVDNGRHGG